MSAIIRNGWEIYFHRNLFSEQRRQLKEQVKQLKANLHLKSLLNILRLNCLLL